MHSDWERDDLILNLVNTLAPCQQYIQDKMMDMLTQCDADYGRRVAEGLKQAAAAKKEMQKGPIGSTQSHDVVVQAEQNSTEAKPY